MTTKQGSGGAASATISPGLVTTEAGELHRAIDWRGAFWVAAGVLHCSGLRVKEWLEFPLDDTQRMETLDISSVEAKVIVCPNMDVDDLASSVESEFTLDDLDEPRKLLERHFDEVYAALRNGDTIDDAWIEEQGLA